MMNVYAPSQADIDEMNEELAVAAATTYPEIKKLVKALNKYQKTKIFKQLAKDLDYDIT